MSKLENGYFYGDSGGNIHFVSYETLGGGGFFLLLIVVATLFLEKFGNFLIDNRQILWIPTLIAVAIRYFKFDKGAPIKKVVCNVLFDTLRTRYIYGVLIALFDKVLSCHVLDRLLAAIGLGLLFAGGYTLVNIACRFFRQRQWTVAYAAFSVVVSFVAILIARSRHSKGQNLDLSLLKGPSNFLSIALVIAVGLAIGFAIKKRLNRDMQAKFDAIGDQLKTLLPSDAGEYSVDRHGISYVDERDERYCVQFEDIGCEPFPIDKEWETMLYVKNMGEWILKNIVNDASKYKKTVTKQIYGELFLQTEEYIRQHTLKKW